MSDPNEQPRTPESSSTSVVIAGEARVRVAELEREAKALGATPQAALLFHEIGLIWETQLKHPRNAAIAFQQAFKLAPTFLANLRDARRLFADVNNWAMVVNLIDSELKVTTAHRAKAALLLEKASLLERKLNKPTEAAAVLAEALAQGPADLTLLVQFEQIFLERQDFASLAIVYEGLAQTLTDDTVRAHFLTAAGLLCEDRLQAPVRASDLYRRAFSLSRRDPLLLSAMKRVSQREGTVDEELGALAAEAENQGPTAAPTFLQISKAYERLGRVDDAVAALVAARRTNPNDQLILAELVRLYDGQSKFEDLAEVLGAWIATNPDQADYISLNLRLAALYEEHLKRDADAVTRYRAILERSPGHVGALTALGKLFARTQNWAGLLETYEAEAAAAEDDQARAAKIFRAAETLEERLLRTEEASARYQECLKLAPGFLPAQKALQRLYERLGKWRELVDLFEGDLQTTTDREQQLTTLHKLSALYEDRLNELPKAIATLKRIQELTPDHLPTIRNLGRLYERTQQWADLQGTLEAEAKLSTDVKQTTSLKHRIAELIEEQLKDRPAAIAAWEQVLSLTPAYLPALRALGRLYGQEGKWDALVKMYRTESEQASSPDQAAALIVKIGELQEHKLGTMHDAIASYREALTLQPNSFGALRALARLYRTQGDWESLVEILHAEAANRTDPTEKANAIFQAAGIWEDQLKKPEAAIEGYQEALRLAPAHPTAMQQLERLLVAKDDLNGLVELIGRQTDNPSDLVKLGAWLKLARLHLDRLNDVDRATRACEAALGIDPKNVSALRLLERIRAPDKTALPELRERIASTLGDTRLSAAVTLASLDLAQPASPEVITLLTAASIENPADNVVGQALERALTKSKDLTGLIALLERRRPTMSDPTDLLQLSLRVGELAEQANDLPRALTAYEHALAEAPGLLPAIHGVSRCSLAMGDASRARTMLAQLAEVSRDPTTQLSSLLAAAKIARDPEKNLDAGIALYRRVLERDALQEEASVGLEELLALKGGAADLAAMHEARADAKQAQGDPAAVAVELHKAARIYLDQVKDREKAIGLLDRALMAVPTLPDALEMKASLALETQSYAEAAAALAVRVQQGGEQPHLSQLHLKLGGLYHDHLSDQTRAITHLQHALEGSPQSVEALERLASIHTQARNFSGAAECLTRLLDTDASTQSRARYTLSLAKITDEGFGDAVGAIGLYRRVLELVPGDTTALDRLVALYERTNAMGELVTVLERQAQMAGDTRRVASLKLRIGAIHTKLGDTPAAVAAYRQIIEIDPNNLPAHVALSEIYGRDVTSISMAIETHRALLRIDPTRVESLHALFKMWEALRQLDKAFCVASLLVFLRASTEMEQAYYLEGRTRLVSEMKVMLTPPDMVMLHHPSVRTPLLDLLQAIGDQFVKVVPPALEQQGIDRKADRLKPDHAVHKALSIVTNVFGVDEFELYQAKRGILTLDTTEPIAICLGPDVPRRFNLREQRFVYGRAALLLADKTPLLRRVSNGELTDILGNSVRILQPNYAGLGRRNEEQTKQLRKAYSRKALKQLEEPAGAIAAGPAYDVETFARGISLSADRAGLLTCGDVSAGLGVLAREDLPAGQAKPDSSEALMAALQSRPELRELFGFALSDDFFRLRQRLGLSLG